MTDVNYEEWEPVIGLEIHVQLNTKTKLFARAPNRFGDEPNTNITEVDTGMPGALPVLNKAAVRKAIQLGCALHSEITRTTHFDRKSYFYPDSPRNFQITQFTTPILKGGYLLADVEGKERHFPITRAHLEDDAGMLKHFSNFSAVDYNRAGAPLIEIVTEPCMHSPKEAAAFATSLRALLLYLDISDCNMEEGSIRFDVNVSVRKHGEKKLRNRIEVKNLNSFTYMEWAIESEVRRQSAAYALHPHEPPEQVVQGGTYRFDVESRKTQLMRRKEEAEDYRYFPEPDLVPLHISDAFIEEVRKALPELPHARYLRYTEKLGLPATAAAQLVADKPLSDYFEKASPTPTTAQALCNWITVEFSGRLKEKGETVHTSNIPPDHITKLISLIEKGTITGKIAKSVADKMVEERGKDPEAIIAENPDFLPLSDTKTLGPIVDAVISRNPQSVADFQAGRGRAFDFLVGQVMKETRGAASPEVVNKLLQEKLKS